MNVPVVKIDAGNPQLELEAVARELALWACGDGALAALGEFGGYGSIGLMTGPDRLHIAEYALSRYKIHLQCAGGRNGWRYSARRPALRDMARIPLRLGQPGDGAARFKPVAFRMERRASAVRRAARCQTAWRRGSARCRKRREKRCAAPAALCEDFEKGAPPEKALSLWRDFPERMPRRGKGSVGGPAELSDLDGNEKQAAAALDELDKKIRKLADDSKDIGPRGGYNSERSGRPRPSSANGALRRLCPCSCLRAVPLRSTPARRRRSLRTAAG